jgi:hypothetical protein
MTSIFRKPLINIVVSKGQVIQVIIHTCRTLLMIPHEHREEVGLQRLRLFVRQDDLQRLRGHLFQNHHLRVFFLFGDNLRGGSSGRCSSRGANSRWHGYRGGGRISSIVIIIILVLAVIFIVFLSHPVESSLSSYL